VRLPLPLLDPTAPPDAFPPVSRALREPNGLLCMGGDLSTERLLAAYRRGIFPWFSRGDPILWWSPDPRALLFVDELHLSRSLRRRLRQGRYTVSADRGFEIVMDCCAAPRAHQPETWIVPEMRKAYASLHRLGHAHSIEVWDGGLLVGGVYGVAVGGLFSGESMFSRADDASKVALVALASLLRARGVPAIDCQVPNPHLTTLGARAVPRSGFLKLLEAQPGPAPGTWSLPNESTAALLPTSER
jgi:leucyl/phenylalanyl-tRNA--protein transferase